MATKHEPGCYVDGARGMYMVDMIVDIAESNGMAEPSACGDPICPRCALSEEAINVLGPVLAELIRLYQEHEEQEINTSSDDRIDALIARAERQLSGHRAGDGSYTEWAHCLYAAEVAEGATEYMESACSADDHYWGFSDQGDWGYWRIEEQGE